MDVTLCDVGPRDGLQNESETFEPPLRAELVNRLAAVGLPRIEAVSFVRDDRVPQMAGAEAVVAGDRAPGGTEYSGLVLERARVGAVRSERPRPRERDVRCDGVVQPRERERNARGGGRRGSEAILALSGDVPATVTISVCFGCPFEGRVDPGVVVELAARFAGRAEVVLADTIGVATPSAVRSL